MEFLFEAGSGEKEMLRQVWMQQVMSCCVS